MSLRITAAERIAEVIGYDLAEMADYRYQSTRHRSAVYTIGDFYYCSPAKALKVKDDLTNLPHVGVVWRECGAFKGVKVYRGEMNSNPDEI